MEYKTLSEQMMESALKKFEALKIDMPNDITIQAFKKVPRHYFAPFIYEEKNGNLVQNKLDYNNLDEEVLKKIYMDTPIVVLVENNKVLSTSSQPFVMAIMIRDAFIKSGNKVLEIGSGSGFNAAVISEITGEQSKVVTIEINQKVADFAKENLKRAGYENIKVITADGGRGYEQNSPYDSILITCGSPEIPMHEQLAENGSISLPLVTRGMETLCSLTKKNGKLTGYLSLYVKFLHFEGIYSDKKQFARNINSLKRVIENYGKRKNDLEDLLIDMMVKDNDDIKIQNEKRKRRTDFSFFLAISDEDALMYESDIEKRENGYGLWHAETKIANNGVLIMFPSQIVHWGNEDIIKRFIKRYEEWKALNNPGINDYMIEFYPKGDTPLSKTEKSRIVERKHGCTVFSLKN